MSAILGIINLNGKAVESHELEQMKIPIAQWGTEASGNWVKKNVGLGQLLSYNTPEARYEKLPFTDASDRYIMVSRARIDNREVLQCIFGVPEKEMSSTPDSFFILESFKKWGKNCVDHLLGDWAFAIWDQLKRELFLARDHHGNTGLFYYKSSNVFIFSSSLRSLLAHKAVPVEINELFVTKILVSWSPLGHETAYSNINRLPPAHYLVVSEETFQVKKYYNLEDTPDLHLSNPSEYYEKFLEVFSKAVKVRLRSDKPVCSTLSGGLDSGAVSALAAIELKKQNQRLKCYCSVPLYDISQLDLGPRRFGDEGFLASETARFSGNIDLEKISAADISIPDSIRFLLATHLEPTHAAGNYFWIAAILKQAQASGFGTLLTGQGGNATISWTGLPEIPSYQSIFRKYSNNEIQLKSAIRQIIRHLVPETFVNLYRKLHAGKDPWKNYSAIDLDYAQKIDLNGLMKNGGHDPLFRQLKGSRQVRFAIIKPGVSQVGSRWQSDGSDYGIEVRDPTSDKDVMELCISIPDNYYRSGNIDRFLLRKSMEDFLPPSVLLNFTRGQQASDLVWRIRDNYNELDQLLKKVSRSEKANSITDIPQMRKILMDTQTLVNREILGETVTTLLRGMAVALFIDQNTH
jgi:asparagine synthase (glutamine-hydrolysing)